MNAHLLALALLASPPAPDAGWVPKEPPKVFVDAPGPEGCKAYLYDHRPAMGTWVELQLCSDAERDLKADADAAFAEFARLEKLLSRYVKTSEVSQINRNAGGAPVKCSPDTWEVLKKAREFSRRSSGLFDITFASITAWNFDESAKHVVPKPADVKAVLSRVGYGHLDFDDERHTAVLDSAGSVIDLGGIGKGFAVDKAVALLRKRGLKSFVVKAGGDLYCAGKKGDRPWKVGVRDPRDEAGGFFATLEVEDAAFSTSGDYERFFIQGGKRYHHIIDPRTGFPATESRQATVLAKSATEAEGLTKPMFIMGPDKGIAWCQKQGAEGLIIGADNKLVMTEGLKARLQVLHPPTAGEGP